MPANLQPLRQALEIMDDWLGLPRDTYAATAYRFAQKLSPEEVLEAAQIARTKIPQGGKDAFRYFCGVCHSMLQEQQIRRSWK